MNDDDPPVRLVLAALFMASRQIAGQMAAPSELRHELVKAALEDADELIRQAGPQ